jgi:hypothetical protein
MFMGEMRGRFYVKTLSRAAQKHLFVGSSTVMSFTKQIQALAGADDERLLGSTNSLVSDLLEP